MCYPTSRQAACFICVHSTTLAKNLIENHDVERTLFNVLGHKRRANIAFSGCALGTDRS